MRAFYINLDRSPARRDFMEREAAAVGLALERVEGVDGRELPEEEYLRLCPEVNGARIGRGELGCFLSHRRVWEIVAAGSDPYAVIFEDDVHIARSAGALLAEPDWIPAGAGLVKVTSNGRRVRLAETPSILVAGRAVHRMLSPTVDAGGYVISAGHARRLVAGTDVFPEPVDRYMMDPRRWDALYQLAPAVVVQGKFADFTFLPEEGRGSLVQVDKPKRPRRSVGGIILGEARNFYRRVLTPIGLPIAQKFRPKARRVIFTKVPFQE